MLEFRSSDLSREEFIATYRRPKRIRTPWGEERDPCCIERDGARCTRPANSLELCRTHYSSWNRRSDPEMPLEQWLATSTLRPFDARPTCIVRGCSSQRSVTVLCKPHNETWTRDKRAGRTTASAEVWAERAAPFQRTNQFSLLILEEPARWEVLYGLQQRDARGGVIEPTATRHLVRGLVGVKSMLAADPDTLVAQLRSKGNNPIAHFREILRAIRVASLEFRGVKPTEPDVWDLATVGLRSKTRSGRREQSATVDLTAVRQTWIREALKEWVRSTSPSSGDFNRTLRACLTASDALHARPGGGHKPAELRFLDMQAIFTAMCDLRRKDGQLISRNTRKSTYGAFLGLLDFGRTAGLLDEMSASFGRHQSLVIPSEEAVEDSAGKAIPEPVIAQLDAHLASIGTGFPYGDLSLEDIRRMMTTVYMVLRDTGRRPTEVASLRRKCLSTNDDGDILTWDNHKKRRYGRQLPIAGETAQAIRTWQAWRDSIPAPSSSSEYLFPSITPRSGFRHMDPGALATGLRLWVQSIPELLSDQLDTEGNRLPFERSLVFPYAFRHSYAQRHADAGIPIDVLKELMDHRQITTTMTYYQNPRELHQTGENPQVTRSERGPTGSPSSYNLAA
ncbi:tyrosine-type recombinase/integrase [Actinacidiphila oryziradicis]|uniref:tyrosine-type recombinase/integrase n=1 Tax=Actinacidiphila oryziradicis TaxID=2571141 RepID=UPI00145F6A4A|nr:tyrosine-type recombinase/integrase [Actinacidiphila oryziradicis]